MLHIVQIFFQAELASVHNDKTNYFFHKILAHGYDVFLGSFKVGTNRYGWLDDSDWDYNNWDASDANNEMESLCSYMSAVDGKWHNGLCNESKTFICQYRIS